MRDELAAYDNEARGVGAAALVATFKQVRDKMYDVVIKSDVGTVDVAWAQKSDTDDDIKRFGLNRSREQKQLRDEFKDILNQTVAKPSAPKAVMPAIDQPKPGQRVSPVEPGKKDDTTPKVKPDEKVDPKAPKTDPNKKDPKKGTP
jgi:hypothetical protein